jgi:hypothetical protein
VKDKLFLLMILLVAPALALCQSDTQSATQDTTRQTVQQGNHISITGCLTSNKHHEYELVDEKGTTNLVYSTSVKLDPYVGQSVTLVGDRAASQSTDVSTGNPTPHFKAYEVHPASGGTCK